MVKQDDVDFVYLSSTDDGECLGAIPETDETDSIIDVVLLDANSGGNKKTLLYEFFPDVHIKSLVCFRQPDKHKSDFLEKSYI